MFFSIFFYIYTLIVVIVFFYRDKLRKILILMDEYIPLGNTRYIFIISKFIILMEILLFFAMNMIYFEILKDIASIP